MRWKELFEEFERRGARRKEFCAERQIKPSTFDYWRARLKRTDGEEAGVIEVGRVSVPTAPIRVRVGERVVIELEGTAGEEQLARVLKAASQA